MDWEEYKYKKYISYLLSEVNCTHILVFLMLDGFLIVKMLGAMIG